MPNTMQRLQKRAGRLVCGLLLFSGACVALGEVSEVPPGIEQGTDDAVATLDDVEQVFATSFLEKGARMGFNASLLGGVFRGLSEEHFQGVARARSGPYLYLSGDRDADLLVVELLTRPLAGRWEANRPPHPPLPEDRLLGWYSIPRSDPSFTHAGGIQSLGQLLAVGLEPEASFELPRSEVAILSITDPADPLFLYRIERSDPADCLGEVCGSAGAVGWTRMLDGRSLLAVGRRDSAKIDFYLNSASPGEDVWEMIYRWDRSEARIEVDTEDISFPAYQSLNLFTQSDGQLYLVGTFREEGFFAQRDRVDLYRLDIEEPALRIVLTRVGRRDLRCSDRCNFNAAAGLYLDADSQVFYLYAVEMRRALGRGWVKFNEF